MFVYELGGCGFESSCSRLNSRFHACFEQGVPWNSGNYGVWIHSKTRMWDDKNIQSGVFNISTRNKWKWLVFFGVCIYIQYFFDVVRIKLQTIKDIYTRVNKKKIQEKNMLHVMWTCFKLWPIKNIFRKL